MHQEPLTPEDRREPRLPEEEPPHEKLCEASFPARELGSGGAGPEEEALLDEPLPVDLDDASMAKAWNGYQETLAKMLLRMGAENGLRETILRTPLVSDIEGIYARLNLLPKLGKSALLGLEKGGITELATRIAGECTMMELSAAAGYRTFCVPALVEGLLKSNKMRDRSLRRMFDTFEFLNTMMQYPLDDPMTQRQLERTNKIHNRYTVAGADSEAERDLFKYIALNMFYIGPSMRTDLTPSERHALCGLTVLVAKKMGHEIRATTRELEEFVPAYEAANMFDPSDRSELRQEAVRIAHASRDALQKIPTISPERIHAMVPDRVKRILEIDDASLALGGATNASASPELGKSAGRGAASFPEKRAGLAPESKAQLDSAVESLVTKKDEWASLSVRSRIGILGRLTEELRREAPAWVTSALTAKGIMPSSPQAGEEWLAGPVPVARNLRLLRQSLEDIEKHGKPRLPGEPSFLPNGQVTVPVFPTGQFDKLLFRGFEAEIRMKPGVTLENLPDTMAKEYGPHHSDGKVALVLAAGNVSSIGPMDLLYKLFVENQVVVLKMNPVNEYLGKHFERIFAELIDRGALRIVYGGASEGEYLCRHGGIDEIHITGSDKTHDAIVFGTGPDGHRRKKERKPLIEKRITSELGNVSPVIVVPGPWSKSDLAFQGENLASMLTNNAGFNCNATRVIITDRGWKQRDDLLDSVRAAFEKAPTRKAYYPGAQERFDAFSKAHPEAERIGNAEPGQLPWLLTSGLDPDKRDEICFDTEAFCSVTSEVPLEADSIVEYIEKAVEFANSSVWGSLNASIIVHPASLKDPKVARAVERAIQDLKAGSVAVNHWAALSYAFVSTTWGAFPGHDIYDIGSGRGVVHNTYMFEHPEKSVVRGPFTTFPKPAWFVTNERAHEIGPKLLELECNPSVLKLPGLLWSALRG